MKNPLLRFIKQTNTLTIIRPQIKKNFQWPIFTWMGKHWCGSKMLKILGYLLVKMPLFKHYKLDLDLLLVTIH